MRRGHTMSITGHRHAARSTGSVPNRGRLVHPWYDMPQPTRSLLAGAEGPSKTPWPIDFYDLPLAGVTGQAGDAEDSYGTWISRDALPVNTERPAQPISGAAAARRPTSGAVLTSQPITTPSADPGSPLRSNVGHLGKGRESRGETDPAGVVESPVGPAAKGPVGLAAGRAIGPAGKRPAGAAKSVPIGPADKRQLSQNAKAPRRPGGRAVATPPRRQLIGPPGMNPIGINPHGPRVISPSLTASRSGFTVPARQPITSILPELLLGPAQPPAASRKSVASSPIRKKGSVRDARVPKPSNYCHCCSSHGSHTVCANFKRGKCRKVLCRDCLLAYDSRQAVSPSSAWTCLHCRGVCPRRAACHTYTRANHRRRMEKAMRNLSSGTSGGMQARRAANRRFST